MSPMLRSSMPVVGIFACAVALRAGPAGALDSACLNGSERKVCVQLVSQPETSVQASKLDGQGETYVQYAAVLTNVALPTSSRRLDVSFTLSPAVDIVSFSSTGSAQCTVSGATATCRYDKLAANQDETITLITTAPEYAGTATAATLVNTGTFGFNGRTSTVSSSLAVTTNGGNTFVPKGKSATLVTHPENPDPSQQTTPDEPLFAKWIIPARSENLQAFLAINAATDEDLTLSCSGGLFFSGNSDGGPYVCRDIGAPFDAGRGTRWVTAALSEPELSFADNPLQFIVIWDDSIVSDAQLPPNPVAPTGLPAFAMLYHAQEPASHEHGGTHPIRAFAETCDTAVPPCLSGVQQYGTKDWTATLRLAVLYDESEADPLMPPALLDQLSALMNELVRLANAEILDRPVIIK